MNKHGWWSFLLMGLACGDPDVFIPKPELSGPAGAITGTLSYFGPPPCTREGQIVGSAVLLAFEQGALPPPNGLGISPAGMTVIPGDQLFSAVRDQLRFEPDGMLWCPPADASVLTESTSWTLSPLPGGEYQIRGFYDLDGDFNPAFSIHNLPSQGDIAGGALSNPTAALAGEAAQYRTIALGTLNAGGQRYIPSSGSRVDNVTVSLARPLPLERPLFFMDQLIDPDGGTQDPNKATIPADYQLNVFSAGDPVATEASFFRLVLGAGVPAAEQQVAAQSPFGFAVESPFFLLSRQDVDQNGVRDAQDHIAETPLIPALLPAGLMAKLEGEIGGEVQKSPTVVVQAITLFDNLLQTALSAPDLAEPVPDITMALRPAALCIDTADPTKEAVFVVTHEKDRQGNVLIANESELLASLKQRFGRTVRLHYGCLPAGRYAFSLVYETSQAWTVPNEAGQCAASEVPSLDGARCGIRPKIVSQGTVLRIGEPGDSEYCVSHPVPSACIPSP